MKQDSEKNKHEWSACDDFKQIVRDGLKRLEQFHQATFVARRVQKMDMVSERKKRQRD